MTENKETKQKEEKQEEKFIRQQYGKVGKGAAVKICSWTKRFLRKGDCCYKHHFYGISTGKCLEMSPVLVCNQRCRHCWRDHSLFSNKVEEADRSEEIIEGCIAARKKLLIGFKGSEKTDKKCFEECLKPKQAAISLSGEPCLYPKLPELIKKFYEKGFESVFLVTNGTKPEMIEKIGKLEKPPTNIYLSVEAWDKESYKDFCKPFEEKQWEKIKETMEVLKKLKKEGKIQTVLRITCIKSFNMDKAGEFKWMAEKMEPKFIECKGYMFLGQSRKRMEQENMPTHKEVKEFGEELARLTGYKMKGEQEESRVVLLGKD